MASMQVEKKQVKQQEHILAKMTNQTITKMHRERYIKFANPGPGPLPPATIEPYKDVTFSHFTPKGAVVYVGRNVKQQPCAWLMAWDTTPQHLIPPSPNKVFAACGHKSLIDKMTDQDIFKCLNYAVSPDAVVTDPVSNTMVTVDLSMYYISGFVILICNPKAEDNRFEPAPSIYLSFVSVEEIERRYRALRNRQSDVLRK